MSFGAGALWLLNSDGTVVRVDPATNAIVARIATTPGALSLAAGDGRVWISCCGSETRPGTGRLLGVDPSADRVTEQIPLAGHPGSLAIGYGAVWVIDDARNALLRVDPTTHAITVIHIAARGLADVASGTGGIWVTVRTGVLVKVDPRTNQVVDTIAVPGSQSGMTTTVGSVWINSGPLVRVDAARDRVSETVPLFSPCDCNAGIAASGSTIWLADPVHETVIRLDSAGGSGATRPSSALNH
jgi:streptogramin lyase